MKTRNLDTTLQAFRDNGGTLRTRDLVALGVRTDALYALRESGHIVELGRGLCRLAESSEAMVALGNANSRMRVFYDVWICSNHLDFDAGSLLEAIDATFRNRKTPVPADDVEALTTAFAEAHRIQWNAFVRNIGETELIDASAGN